MPPTQAQIIARFRPNVLGDLRRRAENVQRQARQNLLGGGSRPRRITTGRLAASIEIQRTRSGIIPAYRIGTNLRYASWVHDGTGIYGPRRRIITARRPGRLMRFRVKSGDIVYTKRVRGMRPNYFLRDALRAAGER